jgi:hypothetical protein
MSKRERQQPEKARTTELSEVRTTPLPPMITVRTTATVLPQYYLHSILAPPLAALIHTLFLPAVDDAIVGGRQQSAEINAFRSHLH